MIPILFRPDADPEALIDVNSVPLEDVDSEQLFATGDYSAPRSFDTYGVGKLTDCISCEVKEERNGEYELTLTYPMDGVHYSEIEDRSIILAKPNYTDGLQAFRVYLITATIDGMLEVHAQHLSYDLSGIPVVPFTAQNCAAACAGLVSHAVVDCPFEVNTTVPTIADFKVDAPSSLRSWFGGREGSLLDVYGGEWGYDNYTCTLWKDRGQDRGVVIRYGKNLLDINQERNISETYTGVLPFWMDTEGGNIVRAGIVNVAGTFNYRKILVLDLSSDFEEKPTAAQLTARARQYITANDIGRPNVNITLDWVQVGELTDRVDLCDTVTVIFEKLGIQTTAKCISTTWDVLADRYTALEIGDVKANMPATIAGLQESEKILTTSVTPSMQRAINAATALITGNSGGYVILHDGDGDGYPDELLIMDTPDISTATKVWRWNKNGLGYSASGAQGPFGLAMTSSGEVVADYITTGTLDASQATITNINASNINTGTLTAIAINNGNGSFQVDASGNMTASSAAITGGYITLDTQNISQGLTLKNTAGTTQTKLTASSIQRTVSGTTVLNMLNGAITANSTITFPNVYTTTNSGGGYVRVLNGGQLCRYVSSSKRYKHDITEELDEDPEKLYDLKPKQFKYNDDYISKGDQRAGKNVLGFIAEEVAELMPGAVDYDDEGRPEMWNVHVIVPAMMKLIQNQKKEIDELRARLDRLEARFSDDGR